MGLHELGYVEGSTIAFEYRFGETRNEQLPQLATELIRAERRHHRGPGTPAVQGAQRATTTVPIVMAYAGDLVSQGFVTSLARPGGNITGLTTLSPELAPKRLQLLKEAFPALAHIGVLYQREDPGRVLAFMETVGAAEALGVRVRDLGILKNEVTAPLAASIDERIDALVVLAGDAALILQRHLCYSG